MPLRIIYNNRLVETAKAFVAVVSPVSLYGRGVFTTLAIYDRHPFLWNEHWSRLMEHAARVRVDGSELDKEAVFASLAQLIEANRVKDGRARLTLLATADDRGNGSRAENDYHHENDRKFGDRERG